jgi:hypothetical protein
MRRTLDLIRRDITHHERNLIQRRTAEVVEVDHTLDPPRIRVRYSPTDTVTPLVDVPRDLTVAVGDQVVVESAPTLRARVRGIVNAAAWNEPEFENSWTAYTTDDVAGLRWRLEPGRVVRLDGAVTGGTLAATIFTLPEEVWPQHRVILPAVSNNAFARVDVSPAGECEHVTGGSNAFVAVFGTFPLG